jgi:hypothetical protein
MSTCRDCIHYDICEELEKGNGIVKIHPVQCGCFKFKSKFVELPCKIGDNIYFISGGKINERQICDIRYDFKESKVEAIGVNFISADAGPLYRFIDYDKIKKRYYFTKEEAEKALQEKRNE